ncbi:MAG: hypothetical protein HXX17_07590 [Geobacteraceae bacterium]|nr:hypothetical protein [Geobacteraceae bacterium]
MALFIKLLFMIPLLIICLQIYKFTSSRKGEGKQDRCQKLGIGYMVIGIISLIERDPVFAFFGLILIMFGFRLMAKGLDRLDKKMFIEQYND